MTYTIPLYMHRNRFWLRQNIRSYFKVTECAWKIMVASVAAMLNLLKGLWFDGELYKFHHWFHMIYTLIMQLRGASFILRTKSRVLLRSEVGMIMVSICLHGVISWSQASGRGRFGPTKPVIAEKYHPSVLKFCLTWTVYNISNKMT